MSNDELKIKLKNILLNMNSEMSFDDFCEYIEKESNGKILFSNLKELVDKYYPLSNKNDKILLLNQIKLNHEGLIKNYHLFQYISKILGKKLSSPILAFYNVADIIENSFNISTIEFVDICGLRMDSEININEFYKTISSKLNLDDLNSIIVFKGCDYLKKGRIKIEDFVLVIDSYREDYLQSNNNTFDFNNEIQYLKKNLDSKFLTVTVIYSKLGGKEYANYNDLLRLLKNEVWNDEEKITIILNAVRKEDKVYKNDFEKILDIKYDSKIEINSENKTYSVRLNESQIYWINKLNHILNNVNITPQMLYSASLDKSISTKIILDNLKKKLKILVPASKMTSMELNSIIDSLNINKNNQLNQKEYDDIFAIISVEKEKMVNKTSKTPDNRSLMNTWVRGKKSVNYHLLPVKGNIKKLSQLKQEIENNINQIPTSNNQSLIKLEQKEETPLQGSMNISKTVPESKLDEIKTSNNKNNDIFDIEIIKVLEELNLDDNKISVYEIFTQLKNKLGENLKREAIFQIVKTIDNDKDGTCTYNDIIKFLLRQLKHRSTKLTIRMITSSIRRSKSNVKDFFNIDCENILTSSSLTEILNKTFDIENPIAKKLFEELKIINSHRNNIRFQEFIDVLDENSYNLTNDDNIPHLGEKEFEESLKLFVKPICKNSLVNFRENIKHLVTLEERMNLHQFKISFIKPLNIDYTLGLAIFQLLKNFTHKNEQFISKSDLFMLLESYIEPKIDITTNNVITNLESSCQFKFLAENIPFNKNGILSSIEFMKLLDNFYPADKPYHKYVIEYFDVDRKGYIKFDDIQNYLQEKGMISVSLLIKQMAALIENETELNCLDYFLKKYSNEINDHISIKKEDHIIITEGLCSNYVYKQMLFDYLSNEGSYNLSKLCNMIDYYRNRLINRELSNKQLYPRIVDELDLSKLENLEIDSKGYIPIISIFKLFLNDENRTDLFEFMKMMDKEKRGYIEYIQLHKFFRNFKNYEFSLNLHLKYLKNNFNKKDNREIITDIEFIEFYKNEMLNDDQIIESFIKKYSEKGKINLSRIFKKDTIINDKNNDKYIDISDLIEKIEKNLAIRYIFDVINIKEINDDGDYEIEKLIKLLIDKFSITKEEAEIITNKFNFSFNYFNFMKFCSYIQENSRKSFVEIKDTILKIKNNIKKLNINQYDQFLKKYNIEKNELISFKSFINYFFPIFKISIYEFYLIFNDILKQDIDNISIDTIFNELGLLELFSNKTQDTEIKLDNYMKNNLIKLANYFNNNKDKAKLFRNYDTDKNGVLSKNEFLTILKSFKDITLNESQLVIVINLADKNKDGKIEYFEFMNFLKLINEQSNKQDIRNPGFVPKLQLNLSIIEKNLNKQGKNKLDKCILGLQKDIKDNYNAYENIENEFQMLDPDLIYIITKDQFNEIINKRITDLDNDIMTRLYEYGYNGLDNKTKLRLTKENKINYKIFL